MLRDRGSVLDRWKEYFSDLLKRNNHPDPDILEHLPSQETIECMDEVPSLDEVAHAVSTLKNLKSPGPDSLPVELLKYGGEQVCTNSRGIALLSTAGKVLAKVLCKRLITHIMERIVPETQWGFRPDRSTNDMIFVARQFFEKCKETCRLIKGIRHCPTWYVEECFFKGWLPTKICQFGEAVSWWNGSICTDRQLKLGIIWGTVQHLSHWCLLPAEGGNVASEHLCQIQTWQKSVWFIEA